MPESPKYGLSESDLKVLRWVVQRVRLLGQDGGLGDVPGFAVTRALSVGTHAAGVTQSVEICDGTWTAIPGQTIDAENPSGVEIPDNTRLILVPGVDSMLIVQAFICTE